MFRSENPEKPHEQAIVPHVQQCDAPTGENEGADPLFGDINPDPLVPPPVDGDDESAP